jgi:hypothetical protein
MQNPIIKTATTLQGEATLNNHCLLKESYEAHKYTVWGVGGQNACSLMLKTVTYAVTTLLFKLIATAMKTSGSHSLVYWWIPAVTECSGLGLQCPMFQSHSFTSLCPRVWFTVQCAQKVSRTSRTVGKVAMWSVSWGNDLSILGFSILLRVYQ